MIDYRISRVAFNRVICNSAAQNMCIRRTSRNSEEYDKNVTEREKRQLYFMSQKLIVSID